MSIILCTLGFFVSQVNSGDVFKPISAPNLNGPYLRSQTPHAPSTGKFPTSFSEYPKGAEYFDIYSPNITSLYSQVFWKGLAPVSLPDEIVARYAGKGMAVIGFEMDQVRRGFDGEPDVSVPITVAYNHHFESVMIGSKNEFKFAEFDSPEDPRLQEIKSSRMGGHGLPSEKHAWIVEKNEDEIPSTLPTKQNFGGANGGEYRLSYHGYAPGFVQVIESPHSFQITPMQIDTWERDKMPISGPAPFVSDALYSGLLECPVTTRISKVIHGKYLLLSAGPSCMFYMNFFFNFFSYEISYLTNFFLKYFFTIHQPSKRALQYLARKKKQQKKRKELQDTVFFHHSF
eukprot:GSMAST32.ASY1.ANO1.611.1 assembled CDS